VERDAPSVISYDAEGKRRPDSPELVAWAKDHHLSPGEAAENAMTRTPAPVAFLAMTGDLRGIPILRQALSSPNFLIQAFAAKGLALVQDKESIPLIIEACRKAPADVSVAIAQALPYFDDDPLAQRAANTFLPKEMAVAIRESVKARGKDPFQ
jgi:HEAT repeat protein